MHTIRFYIRLIQTFIGRFKLLIFGGVVLGCLLSIIAVIAASHFATRNTERIGMTGKFRSDELPQSVLNLTGDGLTKLDATGSPTPSLASSWETSDSGKTWVFHLADGKKWNDGSPVTSQSLKYEFSDVTISHPDSQTITFTLQSAFTPFPVVLARPVFKTGLVGTGEWKVTALSVANSFVQSMTLTDPDGDQKVIKFYPSEDATKLAYKLGEIDKTDDIIDPTPFDKWNGVVVSDYTNFHRLVTVFFNVDDPVLSGKPLRQALNYAIKKDDYNLARASSSVAPTSWAYNSQVKGYDYDPERAKSLLSELPKDTLASLSIKLVTYPALLPIAEHIVKDWNAVGVHASVQITSAQPTDFQAFLAIYDTPADPDQYSLWHSTQESTNISNYKNPRIDKLLEDGRKETNPENRKKIYLDFQRFLVEDSPALFLFYPRYYTISRIK